MLVFSGIVSVNVIFFDKNTGGCYVVAADEITVGVWTDE